MLQKRMSEFRIAAGPTQVLLPRHLLSAAKQSPSYLGENELPNISRLNRVILK